MPVQTEGIPTTSLAKHPELAAISEALIAYCDGREITARCPTCNHVLKVTNLPEIGSRWVTCDTGCTRYHEKYKPREA